MRVLLTSHGSTGDIYPVIALGRALVDAGHRASFATSPFFREDIERAGLDFVYLPPDWSQAEYAEAMRSLTAVSSPLKQLERIYEGARPYIAEFFERIEAALPAHDLLAASYLFPHMRTLAERQGKPYAVLTFCHNVVPTPDQAPLPGLNARWLPRPLRRAWNLFLWRSGSAVVDRMLNRIVRDVLADKELPETHGFMYEPGDLALVTVSNALYRPLLGEVPPRFFFTGYLRFQAPEDRAVEERVAAFTGGGAVPVLTFGSVAFEEVGEIARRFARRWPAGRKIIVQSGWAGFEAVSGRAEILVVGRVSHDQLFRHASVIIHHGGAGTTASALASGRPQVVVPHIADQPFWAEQVARLGAGVRLGRRRWPEKLAGTLDKVLADPARAQAAAACARILANEDGPARAVTRLERYLEDFRAGSPETAASEG